MGVSSVSLVSIIQKLIKISRILAQLSFCTIFIEYSSQ